MMILLTIVGKNIHLPLDFYIAKPYNEQSWIFLVLFVKYYMMMLPSIDVKILIPLAVSLNFYIAKSYNEKNRCSYDFLRITSDSLKTRAFFVLFI